MITVSHSPQKNPRLSVAEKLSVFASSSALAVALTGSPSTANADIVEAMGTPISPPESTGTMLWDIDGDGTDDFRIRNAFYGFGIGALIDDLNDSRFVVPESLNSTGFSKLVEGFEVGPSLGADYKFHASAQFGNTLTFSGVLGPNTAASGWEYGDTGFFGFTFDSAGTTHFGWGEVTIDDRGNAGDGDNFIISRAFYNSTGGASINVGDTGAVPEPSSFALLAFGAAGLATWRRRQK